MATLEAVVPWFFAMNHVNYARCIPVHVRDLKALTCELRAELQNYWVFCKTNHQFAAMPLDQANEQNNEIIKGCGGAIGLTETPAAFRRWMLSSPEQARLLTEFESQYILGSDRDGSCHEQSHATQVRFHTEVNHLCDRILLMGNPFQETSRELMTLDTHDCADQAVVEAIRAWNVKVNSSTQNLSVRSYTEKHPCKGQSRRISSPHSRLGVLKLV